MEDILIRGKRLLSGRVRVSGSKNASLPLLAACLLASGTSRLRNIPDLRDIRTMREMLALLGASSTYQDGVLEVDSRGFACRPAPYDLVRTMRASIYVLAPLLARFGLARVALPGGCAIGLRPIDQHLKGLEAMGAVVKTEHGDIRAEAPDGLHGASLYMDVPSVGATVNILLAAALAQGRTEIEHAACEPEIAHLAECLNHMGARIEGAGTSRLTVTGVERLEPADICVIPDRIEAGTLALAGAITDGDVVIEAFPRGHLAALERKCNEAGIQFRDEGAPDVVRVVRSRNAPRPTDVVTLPHPGFPTDLQAQWMALMCRAEGRAVVTETIWENRFMHVAELNRMGADIHIEGNSALIRGGAPLTGAPVMASDLRASAALILAGLVAEGETRISRVYHLDRGYERMEEKLSRLGAEIRRVPAG